MKLGRSELSNSILLTVGATVERPSLISLELLTIVERSSSGTSLLRVPSEILRERAADTDEVVTDGTTISSNSDGATLGEKACANSPSASLPGITFRSVATSSTIPSLTYAG